MENFYVLLGLNPSDKYDGRAVDDAVRLLTLEQAAALAGGITGVRRMFADAGVRDKMKEEIGTGGSLYSVNYDRDKLKIIFNCNLPPYYGEFFVFSSDKLFEAGPYGADFMSGNSVKEVGLGENTDEEIICSVKPEMSHRYYYPAIKLYIGGRGLCYILGCEENIAFVHDIRASFSYEAVTASFVWGKFSSAFYIIAPDEKGILPIRDKTILKSVVADGETGRAVGVFGDRKKKKKIAFVEEMCDGRYLVLEERGV